MKLYKVSYLLYDDNQKRFIRESKYYADWYLENRNLDLRKKFSKEEYIDVEIEVLNAPDQSKQFYYNDWHYSFPWSLVGIS